MTETLPGRRGAEVLHGHVHEPRHARRADPSAGASETIARLGRARSTQLTRWISAPASLELQQFLAEVGRLVPLPGAEVGDQIDDALLAVAAAEQLGDRLQRRQRAGGGLRDLDLGQQRFQLVGELAADRLL